MSERKRQAERLRRRKRASLVFRKNPITGKREKFSKADIRKNPNSEQSKRATQFFKDRDTRINNEIKAITDRKPSKKDNVGSSTFSNIVDKVGDRVSNIDRSDTLTGLGLLFSGTPIGSVASLLGIANRLNDRRLVKKDNIERGRRIDSMTDQDAFGGLGMQGLFGKRIEDNVGFPNDAYTSKQLLSIDPYENLPMGGEDNIPITINNIPIPQTTEERLAKFYPPSSMGLNARDSLLYADEMMGKYSDMVNANINPTAVDLNLLADANVGGSTTRIPTQPSALNIFPRAVDLGLLADANVGGSTYVQPSFVPSIEASPIVRKSYKPFSNDTSDISQSIIDSITKDLLKNENYKLPSVNFVGDPVLIENPIRALRGDEPIFDGTPQFNLLATTPSGIPFPYESMNPTNQDEFNRQFGLLTGKAEPYGLTVGYR